MSWDTNIRSRPEAFGLEIFGELTDPEASWSFDDVIVWRQTDTGRLGWAADAGCSCPSPFEGVDLSNLNWLDDQAALTELAAAAWNRKREWGADEGESFYGPDGVELGAKVVNYLRKRGIV